MSEIPGKSDLEKFERHWFTWFHDALRWNRAPPPSLGSTNASTQLFIRECSKYVACQTSAPHVCTQSASIPDCRERRTIDTGAKARVRFPAMKPRETRYCDS